MVPCLRLFAYLACQLAKGYPFAAHEYTGGRGRASGARCAVLPVLHAA